MTSLAPTCGVIQPDPGDETGEGIRWIEVRKKRTLVKRESVPPAEASCGGAGPRPTALQLPPRRVPLDTDPVEQKPDIEVHAASPPRKRRRYRRRSVQPDYVTIHGQHTSGRVTLRVLHAAYRCMHTNSRTYGYAHFCAGYMRWLLNLPDSAVPL
jgi:hypothetical protein